LKEAQPVVIPKYAETHVAPIDADRLGNCHWPERERVRGACGHQAFRHRNRQRPAQEALTVRHALEGGDSASRGVTRSYMQAAA
jgi:hypothetical protein